MNEKPNCYQCKHVRSVPGDAHKACANKAAKVSGAPHGIRSGWFSWPFNFDPTWLLACDGFDPTPRAPRGEALKIDPVRCGVGTGPKTCSFLRMATDWECAKGTSIESIILERRESGTMNAMGDNCSGPPDFTLAPEPPEEEAK